MRGDTHLGGGALPHFGSSVLRKLSTGRTSVGGRRPRFPFPLVTVCIPLEHVILAVALDPSSGTAADGVGETLLDPWAVSLGLIIRGIG